MPGSLMLKLLARGDHVAVEQGRLTITAASGHPVPPEWLAEHESELLADVARQSGTLALQYLGHTVGDYKVRNYGEIRKGGVALQFRCLVSGAPYYAIFNAETRRSRATKRGNKGDPLPPGEFRALERSAFVAFWKSTGLPLPRRLSNFHDCMGKLRALTYTGSISKDGRLDAKTLRPLAVRLPQRPDKDRTISRQGPDKDRTRPPDKETARAQVPQGLQSFSTTGQKSHGKTVIRENGNTGSPLSPELQSNDEWLADYSAAGRNVASRQ